MDLTQLYEELAVLTAINAPSGFEEPILGYISERFEKITGEVNTDIRGNLYATVHGDKADAPLVMVIAHGDEIGFMVTGITPGGFLRFVKLGGPTDMVLPGHRVKVLGTNGPLDGIIGVKPGHVLSGEEARRVPPIPEMYIDICAGSPGGPDYGVWKRVLPSCSVVNSLSHKTTRAYSARRSMIVPVCLPW